MELVRQEFPVVEDDSTNQEVWALSYAEQNALQYAAGYVPRHLKQRLKKSAHPMKERADSLSPRPSSGW
jgi:hypothetical protein